MGKHTTKGDGGLDEGVQLLVSSNGELEVARRDALDFEILGGVAGQLENFGCEVFEDGGQVNSSLGADAGLLAGDVAKMALDATAGELKEFNVS